MNAPLRICIASRRTGGDPFLARLLARLGHETIAMTSSGADLIKTCILTTPDLILAETDLGDMSCAEAARIITRVRPTPFVLVLGDEEDPTGSVNVPYTNAVLVCPFKIDDLKTALAVAGNRFARFRDLSQEVDQLRKTLHQH